MNSQQLQRRDEITQALWAIEDSMPVGSPEIHMAAERAIGELEELLLGVDPYANPLEAGRTWRYVGDACITSAGNEDAEGLAHAQRAYTTAEPLIEAGGDALEIAKLNFNHANALRLICHSQDRTMMEDASKRYLRSLKLFRTAMPSAVPKVENALQQTYAALSLLSMMESIQGSQDHTRELIERLQNAELSDAQVDREVERELDRLKTSDESPAGQLQGLRTLLQQLVPMLAASDSPDQATAFEQETRTDLAKLFETIDPETFQETEEMNELFRQFGSQLTEQAVRDGVPNERLESGLAVLDEFKQLVVQSPQSIEGKITKAGQMRGVLSRFKHIYADQGVQGATPGTRAEALVPHLQCMQAFVFDEMNQRLGATEQQTFFSFLSRLSQTRRALSEAAQDEPTTLRVEYDRLRPLAHAIRRTGLRQHLTLAAPFWGWQNIEVNPNLIFFAGGPELKRMVNEVCVARGLELSDKSKGWDAGQVRWNQLRESSVGIFDMTTKGSALASVCHALGGALVLGLYPIVVVSGETGPLPFDVDLPPLQLSDREDAVAQIGPAIDQAIYGIHSTTGLSSVEETLVRVLAISDGDNATTRVLKNRLEARPNLDPMEAEETLDLLLSANDRVKPVLLRPLWPGFYPDEHGQRCFHVMPFRREWSNPARDVVRGACEGLASYRRGDETEEQKIIHSIWEEICRATHVVVDLTGLNPNVCLELGIAQALGRPTLLIAQEQEGTIEALFPEISKLQIKSYQLADGGSSLSAHVAAFLQ